MKFKPFISQIKSKDISKFPQLSEQSECAKDLANFTEYIKKSYYYKRPLSDVSVIFLKKKTVCLHL